MTTAKMSEAKINHKTPDFHFKSLNLAIKLKFHVNNFNIIRTVIVLDASKVFDRVNYCKLFAELLKRNICPLLLRLLLFMYTRQSVSVKWGNTVSSEFTVSNGVKQGGVLSPILFAIYTDVLLKRLEETGVGCHTGSRFTASELDILFNGSKSKLLFFKGRFSNGMDSGIMVNGEMVNISDNVVHLGHTISSSDRESIF